MNHSVIEALKRIYNQSSEPVMLLDEKWQIIWQNQPTEIGYLPELLGISEDFWEGCVQTVRLGHQCFTLRLMCSQEDGIRTATLLPEPLATIPMETRMIADAVQSISASCSSLSQTFEDNDIFDKQDELTSLIGNCLRLYRPAYLQNELERQRSGKWAHECFSVKQQLVVLHERVRKILGKCAEVTLDTCEEAVYFKGDTDAFIIAVLSGLMLCCRDVRKRQDINIKLTANGETFFIVTSMTPTPEERSDTKYLFANFGSTYDEQLTLQHFCENTGGHYMQGSMGNTVFCRIELPCCELSDSGIVLNSNKEQQESRYFNKYELLLARLRYYAYL